MIRCVIYARYSSDQQSPSSIHDQVRECREVAARQGWDVVEVYSDAALSGGSDKRPGFQQMLDDASDGRFDIVVAEALDRLSRRLADTASVFDQFNFYSIRIFTKNEREITKMHVAIVGLMAEQFVADLREKTKRGQRGRVLEGKTAGGLGYGYVVGDPGERAIDEAQAEIVRRIFREYATGLSPRAIAHGLNSDGIPGPRGRTWKDTTLRGQRDRCTGILNNTAYIGQLAYGRTAYVKNPTTGKRVARPQPRESWLVEEVSELRIVEDDLWKAVKDRQDAVATVMPRDEKGKALNRVH